MSEDHRPDGHRLHINPSSSIFVIRATFAASQNRDVSFCPSAFTLASLDGSLANRPTVIFPAFENCGRRSIGGLQEDRSSVCQYPDGLFSGGVYARGQWYKHKRPGSRITRWSTSWQLRHPVDLSAHWRQLHEPNSDLDSAKLPAATVLIRFEAVAALRPRPASLKLRSPP